MKDYLIEEAIDGSAIARRNAAIMALFCPPVDADPTLAEAPGMTPALATAPTAAATGTPVPVRRDLYRRIGKRVLDIVLVLATLPITLPIVLVCAAALWIEGGYPFYRQDRLGTGGARFSIIKLRTMVRDADTCLQGYLDADPALRHEWATTQKLKHDPRITRVGGFLRATSLDELPQFWNVLTGDMSLVGPRPMLPDQLGMYGDAAHYFEMRPGITGFWQVSARNESHFSFRAEIDAQYHRRVSLACDIGVLLRTVGVVLRRTGY